MLLLSSSDRLDNHVEDVGSTLEGFVGRLLLSGPATSGSLSRDGPSPLWAGLLFLRLDRSHSLLREDPTSQGLCLWSILLFSGPGSSDSVPGDDPLSFFAGLLFSKAGRSGGLAGSKPGCRAVSQEVSHRHRTCFCRSPVHRTVFGR